MTRFENKLIKENAGGVNLRVSGTPTFFINNQQVVGTQPFSVFERVIELELNKSKR